MFAEYRLSQSLRATRAETKTAAKRSAVATTYDSTPRTSFQMIRILFLFLTPIILQEHDYKSCMRTSGALKPQPDG